MNESSGRQGKRLYAHAIRFVRRASGRYCADAGIGRVSVLLIAAAVLVTGTVSYSYLNDLLIKDRSTILEAERDRRAQHLRIPLQAQVQMVGALGARHHIAQAIHVYQDDDTDVVERTSALLALQFAAGSLVRDGSLRAAEVQSLDGEKIATAAHLPELPQLAVRLSGSQHVLYWDHGFILRVRTAVVGADGPAGLLVADLEVPDANEALEITERLGKTGEVKICGQAPGAQVCFPSRFQPAGSVTPLPLKPTHPADRALRGEQATEPATDYRGRLTFSSFQPLGELGLAIVVKVDEDELLAPVRRQAQLGLPLLILLAAAGAAIMRFQLKPLTTELVSARSRADAEVASSALANRRLQTIADHASFLIAFIDPDFVFRFANRAHIPWFRKPMEEIVGQPMQDLVGPAVFQDYEQAMAAALATRVPQPVFREMLRDGSSRFMEVTFAAQFDVDGTHEGYCITARDATDTVLREKTLLLAARRDPLTGLCNRTSFNERLEHSLRHHAQETGKLAIAYLDIDYFKQVNDNYGHDVGDELLKVVACRLQAALRRADTVARLGGDEFAMILPDLAAPDDAYVIAAHVQECLHDPIMIKKNRIQVSVSIGFAIAQADDSQEAVISRADQALYKVKRSGRNGAFLLEQEESSMLA
jgi:diguanylate cyclase (GGDEF)-like protein/PAS domain S-box-containing protein